LVFQPSPPALNADDAINMGCRDRNSQHFLLCGRPRSVFSGEIGPFQVADSTATPDIGAIELSAERLGLATNSAAD